MKLFRRRPPPALPTSAPPRPSGHLFVIGMARSGTTVLLDALNSSNDIYLFGEPNFHHDHGPGFAARFNDRHRDWHHQVTKGSYCPPVLDSDEDWPAYLARLGASHRWTGSKIVINPNIGPTWIEEMFAFHCRRFYDARHVFTFREPQAVVLSAQNLQSYTGATLVDLRELMRTYAATVACFTRMLRVLPHVTAIVHEDAAPETFTGLARWLDVDLAEAWSYYSDARVRRYDGSGIAGEERQVLDELQRLYADLRTTLRDGLPRRQLEQNDDHFEASHFTAIGSIDRRARVIDHALRTGTVATMRLNAPVPRG